MIALARLLSVFGALMTLLSVVLLDFCKTGTPERMMNQFNIGLGILMVFFGVIYLMYQKKKQDRKGG